MRHLRFVAVLIFLLIAVGGSSQPKPSGALKPADAAKTFQTPEDLKFEQVLAEPAVRQPVHLSFDERGRLWVVQYLQYPHPAGLKMLSRDGFWRAIYDKVPPPPPKHFPGLDKITIHEDTDGDGVFDKHKTFIEGLNIVTAVARGRGGVWVLNPPYLLFYPDKDNDDVPDGDPVVHLEGFGLEDTHSCVNSLCWGPDGWLYAAQGSTVTGKVKRPGLDKEPVKSMGQLIWRYHPESRRYEIFAEGGGNAFGVEIDSIGRIFSGHNGGDTRGFHYVQGGYFLKGFAKHGPLSNPYAFGYFPAMKHNKVQRFTHTYAIYEGNTLPAKYRGQLFGVAPLLHHVVLSDVQPDGSTLQTKDIGHAVTTTDNWFTPVDIKLGPDGALYVADWYDSQTSHIRNHEGQIDKDTGRVYRLQAVNAKPSKPFDLSKLSSAELIELLAHENKWQRQTALRLLGDRQDKKAIAALTKLLRESKGGLALEALWALNLSGGFDETIAEWALTHENPHVRRWTVRLLGDKGEVSARIADALAARAAKEPDVLVRSQMASTARRLSAKDGLAIAGALLTRSEDGDDLHLPLLLWWAIEARVETDAPRVLKMFEDPQLWDLPLVRQHITERLMRRLAATGQRKDLLLCARLLKLSPGKEHTQRLMAGFEAAYAGRAMTNLPDELNEALADYSRVSIVFGLRQGRQEAIRDALALLDDPKGDKTKQQQYIQVFGEVAYPECVPALLRLATTAADDGLRSAALSALVRYDDAKIAPAIVDIYPKLSEDLRESARTLLASRKAWALRTLEAIDQGKIDRKTVPAEFALIVLRHGDDKIAALVKKHWGELRSPTPEEMQKEIDRLAGVVKTGAGVPKQGKVLYTQHCGKCHTLFGQGGAVGPDLTPYQRDNLDAMLLHVVNPNAEIREGFATMVVLTGDGRRLQGLLVDQDPKVVVLRPADGKDLTLRRDEIDELTASKQSLMPEGLLRDLNDQQVRDLFAYLRSSQPVIDK